MIIVKPGEKIPTDGVVVKGDSAVDESMVTGESIPSDKTVKSNVIGATINQDGILYIKATKVGISITGKFKKSNWIMKTKIESSEIVKK